MEWWDWVKLRILYVPVGSCSLGHVILGCKYGVVIAAVTVAVKIDAVIVTDAMTMVRVGRE